MLGAQATAHHVPQPYPLSAHEILWTFQNALPGVLEQGLAHCGVALPPLGRP